MLSNMLEWEGEKKVILLYYMAIELISITGSTTIQTI